MKASEKLRISQPAISEQIRELENTLGEKLFQKSGRGRELTEVGQMVLGYADEIFQLGEELLNSVHRQGSSQTYRLHVGVVDSFPKLMTNKILQPVFDSSKAVHVICREGKLSDLLGQLIMHRLDVILADEPATPGLNVQTYNHRLGESTLTVAAAAGLCRHLKSGFPESLNDAPALLPAAGTSLRRAIEHWFHSMDIHPRVLAEFEDLALMNALAEDGKGFIILPTAAFSEARQHYGLESLGLAATAKEYYYAISAERRIKHPLVAEITRQAQEADLA